MSIEPDELKTLTTIVLGVVMNGLTSLLAASDQEVAKQVVGRDILENLQLEPTALPPSLLQTMIDMTEDARWSNASRGVEILSLFLQTAEVEEFVRQVYAVKLLRHNGDSDLSSLRTLFVALLMRFLTAYAPELVPGNDQPATAPGLFDVLLQGCDYLLQQTVDTGILTAHEARGRFRYNVLKGELAAIQHKLDLLTAQQKPDMRAILAFEQQYRRQMAQRHRFLTPANFEGSRKSPIDDLYVYPHVAAFSGPELMDAATFLARAYRVVLLGPPGAGKSALAVKLCYDLAHNYSQRHFAGRKELTPILVLLRNYGAARKEMSGSLLEFIETEVKATYQVSQPPPQAFEYLLLTGRAMVIFDGLDELLDTRYRQEISSEIEAFCRLYPSAPILVTSREVGYQQAPLDEDLFEVFRLSPFTAAQVEQYVKQWFAAVGAEDTPDSPRQRWAEAFLEESQFVPDLRSNPLMLSLLCSIYRGEGYLPRHRTEVYEKCALMLYERWDKSQALYAPPLPEEHVRPLIEYLAYWIYEDERLRGGVTEEELTAKGTEYLHEWLYEDRSKAERTAREFIAFCRGRAWVFTDTGTLRDGERLYQFTHTIFLEYFAASYLARASRASRTLLNALVPHIAKREWDVMAQLAFQLDSKRRAGAGDELLTALINPAHTPSSGEASFNLLSFAVRCLQFIIPRERVVRSITEACIERCMRWGLEKRASITAILGQGSPVLFEESAPAQLFQDLIEATPENRARIAETVRERLVAYVISGQEAEARLALEIALSITGVTSKSLAESMPTYQRALEDLARGSRTWVRQVIVETLSASFGTLLVEEPSRASIEMINGSVMVTDEAHELVLRVTNNAKTPLNHMEIELSPSAEYDLLTPRAFISSLAPRRSSDVCFRLQMKVARQVAINYRVNGELKAPPFYVVAIRDNPYTISDPVDEAGFFGRQEELEQVLQSVTKPAKQDIFVVGERRAGKTSLLLQLSKRLSVPAIPVYINLSECRPRTSAALRTDDVLDHVLHRMVQSLIERNILGTAWNAQQYASIDFTDRVYKVIQEARRNLPAITITLLLDEADVLLEIEKEASSPFFLTRWLRRRRLVDEAAQRILRAALQSPKTGSYLRAVVAGTTALATYTSSQHSSPFFNHFRFVRLKPLSDEETRQLIVEPAEMRGLSYLRDATQRITTLSGCQPFYCQALCQEAFAHAQKLNKKYIGEQEVAVAEEKIREDLFHGYHSYFWSRATRKERNFLAALVRGKVLQFIPKAQTERLLDWQLITRTPAGYRFSAGLFEQWTAMALKDG
jgi:GTPase SAR1 family protein